MSCKKLISAMERVYSPFEKLTEGSAGRWSPGLLSEGHRGRYLWTDGFAVVNFLTLFKERSERKYLTCAKRLIDAVHSTLGYTRNGDSRLRPATDDEPLLGGLRIGKLEESGDDGDGQYFHYLTIWMFALVQTGLVSKDKWYISQAKSLAKAIHPKFVIERKSNRPRMFWKMSMDLSHPLVTSEGNLDPIDGFVIYSMVEDAGRDMEVSEPSLMDEIQDYKKIVKAKAGIYYSMDPLDLGMTLWTTSHWPETLTDTFSWRNSITDSAKKCLEKLALESKYFERPLSRRLAFREFGTILGIKSHPEIEEKFGELCNDILRQWETSEIFSGNSNLLSHLEAITFVMYATALNSKGFLKHSFT